MEKVETYLVDIERKLGKVMKISEKGPDKMTIKDMIKMTSKGNSIVKTNDKMMKEYRALTPSESQNQTIINLMKKILELQEKQMQDAIKNKPHFDKIHAAGMVKKNLKKNEPQGDALSDLLIEKSSPFPSQKSEAEAMKARSKKSFNDVMKAYEGATGGEDQVTEAVDDSD
ncbi:hypothetical protein HYFRA_00008555 [Hymenoscyphus fraxineus]|uniref:Uncharacterized protein n=1 Tax=Hymenoscyphus fraxineus TaxID=746836 RepID=A0A9N9KVY7_9HELO|nr:hypothetical protein HYFRA_00008555 [Hymenoscyphus fraxineus]